MQSAMKILMLTNRVPYPLTDGGSLAIHYFIEGYIEAGISVSLLAMNTSRHFNNLQNLPSIYQQLDCFKTVNVNNNITIPGAINAFIKNKSYNVIRFEDINYQEALINCLNQETYDIIQLEGLFLTPYLSVIKAHSKAKIVLRSHNVEYQIWERLYQHNNFFIKKWYLKHLAKKLKEYEIEHLNQYDAIIPISDIDLLQLQKLGAIIPMKMIPFGIKINDVNIKKVQNPNQSKPVKLYHLAAMDWLPNQESLQWLLDKVVPILDTNNIEYELYIAGRNMPKHFFNYENSKIKIIGTVLDATQFESDKDILLVPLQSGGGVRIKIFQAMANGKAIITTSIGVEGITAIDNEHLLIADTPEAFAKKIQSLQQDPELINRLGKNSMDLIFNKYNRTQQINQLINWFQKTFNIQ